MRDWAIWVWRNCTNIRNEWNGYPYTFKSKKTIENIVTTVMELNKIEMLLENLKVKLVLWREKEPKYFTPTDVAPSLTV
jgi:hypothetical protein